MLPQQPLHPVLELAQAGDVAGLRAMEEDAWKKALRLRDADERTALHRACAAGHGDAARLLLEKGADADLADEAGWNPLHSSAARGDGDLVRLLLEARAEVGAKTGSGATALHMAASKGHGDAVRGLLEAGAPKDARDKQGGTPLLRAVGRGQAEVVRLLLGERADLGARDAAGENAFHVAINGHWPAICEILMASEEAEELMMRENEDGKSAAQLLLDTQPLEMRETLKSLWRRRGEATAIGA